MNFTFQSYREHVFLLLQYGYAFVDYLDNSEESRKIAILRHDVDFDITKAYRFAEFEFSIGVKSTFFVLLSSKFYNLLSKESQEVLKGIIGMGHDIGLHFDETVYEVNENPASFLLALQNELSLLSTIIHQPVRTVSMHRPSQFALAGDFEVSGIVNSYSQKFFRQYKYVSDSRMNWRENLREVIEKGKNTKLHILTHPFWYSEAEETTREKLLSFINAANHERYQSAMDNFRDIGEFVLEEDIR